MSDKDAGFSLVESVMSLAVIVTGTLGVATLAISAILAAIYLRTLKRDTQE